VCERKNKKERRSPCVRERNRKREREEEEVGTDFKCELVTPI
jgi:hypothetical protein